jgi:hypothetical protein
MSSVRILAGVMGLGVLASATVSQAAVAYIDFGPTATTATGWSNFTTIVSTPAITNAQSTAGTATTWDFATGGWTTAGTSGKPVFEGNAETVFGGTVGSASSDFFGVQNAAVGTLTISDLSPLETYTITVFASRNATGDRTGLYTVTGLTGPQSQTLNASQNSFNYLTFSNVAPAVNGTITLTTALGQGNDQTYAYLNAVKVESAPVPEPAALGLLGVAACGLLRRRRAI